MTTSLFRTTVDTICFAGAGYIYSQYMGSSSPLTVSIAIISRLTQAVFLELLNRNGKEELSKYSNSEQILNCQANEKTIAIKAKKSSIEKEIFYNYAAANLIVNSVTIVALQHFKLIGNLGIGVLFSLALGNVFALYLAASSPNLEDALPIHQKITSI